MKNSAFSLFACTLIFIAAGCDNATGSGTTSSGTIATTVRPPSLVVPTSPSRGPSFSGEVLIVDRSSYDPVQYSTALHSSFHQAQLVNDQVSVLFVGHTGDADIYEVTVDGQPSPILIRFDGEETVSVLEQSDMTVGFRATPAS